MPASGATGDRAFQFLEPISAGKALVALWWFPTAGGGSVQAASFIASR